MPYPPISSVPSGSRRPLWSVVVLDPSRGEEAQSTLDSVAAATEDADAQIEVVQMSFGGEDLSLALTACVDRTTGEWVHIVRAGDLVLPYAYRQFAAALDDTPDVVMVFTRPALAGDRARTTRLVPSPVAQVAASGVVEDAEDRLLGGYVLDLSTAVVSRAAYEACGGFHPGLREAAAHDMCLRLARHGRIAFVSRPCCLIGTREAEPIGRPLIALRRPGEYLDVIDAHLDRLPRWNRRAARRRARTALAELSDRRRVQLHGAGQHRAALQRAIWAARLAPRPKRLVRLGQSAWRVIAALARQRPQRADPSVPVSGVSGKGER